MSGADAEGPKDGNARSSKLCVASRGWNAYHHSWHRTSGRYLRRCPYLRHSINTRWAASPAPNHLVRCSSWIEPYEVKTLIRRHKHGRQGCITHPIAGDAAEQRVATSATSKCVSYVVASNAICICRVYASSQRATLQSNVCVCIFTNAAT